MFTLPALLYLKVLPLFGQCLYHLIVPNKSRPLHMLVERLSLRWSSTGLTPFLGRPGQLWVFLHYTNGRTFDHYIRFNVQQASYTADLQWSQVSNMKPSGPKAETLPLGHRGLFKIRKESRE
ncbi:hypothetical protein AVEN_117670-1 [Araneus ventricosus]|uniref:Uncharacterized protein n=1 Tax=Araneus ventricosus TaxID=182803 RepID=A0A4Y2VFJ2_ARAVE|nr:hypothetical protein AVEN_117670-1 [Araneus ventricosus]